ncbi:MAG: lysine--tRNA ligase [Proteobacteria bacterium]|nr:lysine--tRNA ligase [Pseudomonadota bacterium]
MATSETDIRRQKLENLRGAGKDPYPNDFAVTHTAARILDQAAVDPESLGEEGQVFSTAGRLMGVNRFGKAAFFRFKDRTGQIQAYVRRDKLPEEVFALSKDLDMGDFIGVTGPVFKTRAGEWTILATDLKLLAKALRPLPEKFHGLKDPEKRYRQRYLDLIMNPEVRETFVRRSRITAGVREFLASRDFLEVETPMMQVIPGGAEAEPFRTHHNALDMDMYLRIAPELYLKRLVVGGMERVFEINRNFRNEGISTQHNPEFTMLEFYQAYATYEDLMDLTEEMLSSVAADVLGATLITYQGQEIELAPPYRRISLAEALARIGGVAQEDQGDRERLLEIARERGVTLTKTAKIGKILTKLFDALVEPKLIAPTFITHYPVEISPLSRRNAQDPSVVDRFELFIAGRELANGFSELNDPDDQRGRFMDQVRERDAGDAEAHFMDEDYVEALEYGLPPTAGEGIGMDRLVMLLTDAASIREVILFPHMRNADKGSR